RVPHYRQLSPQDEEALLARHMNQVTDTCIPEGEAMRRIESAVLRHWVEKDKAGKRLFPPEFMYEIIRDGSIRQYYQIDPKDSWMVAAAEKNLPMFVPGWEDSTLGNMYSGHCIYGAVKNVHTVRPGIETMIAQADFYARVAPEHSIGFFQIGGGIAGDFPICVVPMLEQSLKINDIPRWGFFCKISDSPTVYG